VLKEAMDPGSFPGGAEASSAPPRVEAAPPPPLATPPPLLEAQGFAVASTVTEPLCAQASLDSSSLSMFKRNEDGHCSLEASRELGAAAEAVGARARGEVTLAIRAKAVCRLAASAASRRLLSRIKDRHVSPPAVPEEELRRSRAPAEAEAEAEAEDGTHRSFLKPEPCAPSSGRRVRCSDAEPEFLAFPAEESSQQLRLGRGGGERSREIRVPANTPLGQMIKRDPERAAKYNLAVVPPWTQNKPWPPPPVKPQRRVPPAVPAPRREDGRPARGSAHRSEGGRTELRRKAHIAWAEVRAVSKMVGLATEVHTQAAMKHRRPELHSQLTKTVSFHLSKEEIQPQVEFRSLQYMFVGENELEHYAEIFERFASGSGGHLTRQGLQRAMREAGLVAGSVAEQQKFKQVQGQVLQHCRGAERLEEEPNPLTSSKGVWEREEFLLMVAGMLQLDRRERWSANKAVADELGLSTAALEEYRQVFDEADRLGQGVVRLQEMQRLLAQADLHPTDKELKLLLRRNSIGEELSFPEFLQVMVKVEEFVHPGQHSGANRADS